MELPPTIQLRRTARGGRPATTRLTASVIEFVLAEAGTGLWTA